MSEHNSHFKINKLTKRLIIIVIIMFGFSFALVPFYSLFCKVTGLNGKIDLSLNAHNMSLQKAASLKKANHFITMEFDVTRNQKMPLEFKPQDTTLQIRPGQSYHTHYYAKNSTNHTMVIQAIPSISPGIAAKYIKKIECFCFERQTLKSGESALLPIQFIIDSEIPIHIDRLTLSYTLFEIKDKKESKPNG
ncbi:MAG: ctaG [Francisellaceae bacterium]|nr:ctaG [Francisellaceae bacterium]